MSDRESVEKTGDQGIDLEEVARLITRLEDDLAKVQTGSQDVQALRDEVEALRNILSSSRPGDGRVSEQLHNIRSIMHTALDTVLADAIKGAEYVRQIGRMLGM